MTHEAHSLAVNSPDNDRTILLCVQLDITKSLHLRISRQKQQIIPNLSAVYIHKYHTSTFFKEAQKSSRLLCMS